MGTLDHPLEAEVRDDLGRDLADGAEGAKGGRVGWAPHQDIPSHRQTPRCPK